MDRERLRQSSFKYVLLAAAFTTVIFGASIVKQRPDDRLATADAVSVTRHPSQAPAAAAAAFVLEIPCWDKPSPVKAPPAGTRWLRITGKVCGQKVAPETVTITNETNHSTATIFPAGGGMTTDLIGLAEGANQVRIRIARDGGDVETSDLNLDR